MISTSTVLRTYVQCQVGHSSHLTLGVKLSRHKTSTGGSTVSTTGSDPQPDAPVSNVAWPRPLDPSSSSLGYPLGPRPVTARYLGASTGPWKAPRVVGSSSQPPSRPADRTQPSSGRASRGPLAGEHKHWIPMGLKQQRPGKLESSMTHRASKHGTGELQRPAEGPARAEGPVDTSNMEDQAVPAFASIIRHRAWQRRIDAT